MRVRTGISGFDELIEGGLIKNQLYLVSGSPGSGRSTFGIRFLVQGALQNEKGLYVALTEKPANVIKFMSRYDFNLVNHVKEKKIFFMDGTQELLGDSGKTKRPGAEGTEVFDFGMEPSTTKTLFEKIEPIIKKTGITRLVVDSTVLLAFLTKTREIEEKQMVKNINILKQMEVTTVLLSEQVEPNLYKLEHYLCDGIILMHNLTGYEDIEMNRAIQIIKMRGTKHDNLLHPLSFTDGGLLVGADK